MEKSFPFNAELVDGTYDRLYSAEDFAAEKGAYYTSGILGENSFAVSVSGLSVTVASGSACLAGYTYFNTAPLTLTLAAADATNDRVDAVVLLLDKNLRSVKAKIVTGTPAAAPVAPTLTDGDTQKYLLLATIKVEAGASEADAPVDKRVPATNESTLAGFCRQVGLPSLSALNTLLSMFQTNGTGTRFLSDNGTYLPSLRYQSGTVPILGRQSHVFFDFKPFVVLVYRRNHPLCSYDPKTGKNLICGGFALQGRPIFGAANQAVMALVNKQLFLSRVETETCIYEPCGFTETGDQANFLAIGGLE